MLLKSGVETSIDWESANVMKLVYAGLAFEKVFDYSYNNGTPTNRLTGRLSDEGSQTTVQLPDPISESCKKKPRLRPCNRGAYGDSSRFDMAIPCLDARQQCQAVPVFSGSIGRLLVVTYRLTLWLRSTSRQKRRIVTAIRLPSDLADFGVSCVQLGRCSMAWRILSNPKLQSQSCLFRHVDAVETFWFRRKRS
jgi:hypothetical protein